MSNLLLTLDERERFASWLEREVESSKGIIQQMEKLPNSEAVTKRYKQEAVACLIIARKLRSTEEMTL